MADGGGGGAADWREPGTELREPVTEWWLDPASGGQSGWPRLEAREPARLGGGCER